MPVALLVLAAVVAVVGTVQFQLRALRAELAEDHRLALAAALVALGHGPVEAEAVAADVLPAEPSPAGR